VAEARHDTGTIRDAEAQSRRMFLELNRRQNGGHTVLLEWNHDTGETQIVVAGSGDASSLAFLVSAENAGDAFRHPFRYAP